MYERLLARTVKEELAAGRSLLLMGPRQTGKTTLIKSIVKDLPRHLEYDCRLPSVRFNLETDPESLKREVEALGAGANPPIVFIDEIQKVPPVLDVLQYLLDEKKIILIGSGSSARTLRRRVTNWLPGRVRLKHLYPLTWQESGLTSGGRPPYAGLRGTLDPPEAGPRQPQTGFLAERLLFGGLPGILAQSNLEARVEDLKAYATLYLDEEIRQEAAVRRLAPFGKFLEIAALESGSSPNLSKMGSQVGVTHPTVREYFQILEDTLIAHRLSVWGESRADILQRSKYYFFDLGVRHAACGLGHSEGILKLQMGNLFEHHVILELLARGLRLSWWRTKKGEEIDCVVETSSGPVAVEIKATANPVAGDFKGLAAFQKQEKCHKAFLVCQVERPQKFDAGLAIPWWELEGFE